MDSILVTSSSAEVDISDDWVWTKITKDAAAELFISKNLVATFLNH